MNKIKKPDSNYRKLLIDTGYIDWIKDNFCPPLRKGPDGNMTNRPSPFYRCDICEKMDSHIEMAHMGKYNVCNRHPKERMHLVADPYYWRENVQISIATSIIREISK